MAAWSFLFLCSLNDGRWTLQNVLGLNETDGSVQRHWRDGSSGELDTTWDCFMCVCVSVCVSVCLVCVCVSVENTLTHLHTSRQLLSTTELLLDVCLTQIWGCNFLFLFILPYFDLVFLLIDKLLICQPVHILQIGYCVTKKVQINCISFNICCFVIIFFKIPM